ncbi:replication initiation protein [Tortoise microvirus 32]|nr:replication initiation protein [Tortoise microvirus 32]
MYCNIPDGKKIAMPRYYKNKIYEEHERQIVGKIQREKILEAEAKLIEEKGLAEYEQEKALQVQAMFERYQFNSQKNRNKV